MDQIVSIPQIIVMYAHPQPLITGFLAFVYALTVSAVILFFIQFYRYKIQRNHSRFGSFSWNRIRIQKILLMVLLWLGLMFLQVVYIKYLGVKTAENQVAIERLFNSTPIWTFIDGVLLAPIMEELIFRGIFFELFFRSSRRSVQIIGVIINGCIFGALHDIGMSFPIYALMGILLATTYLWTRDIKASTTIHILNNLISFI